MNRSFALAVSAGLAVSGAHAQPAGPGGFSVWSQPVSESWFDAFRWDAGVPQTTQTAIIGQPGAYEVSILNNVANCHHLGIGLPTISVRVAHATPGGQAWLTVNGTQVENAGTITLGGAGHLGQANFQLGTNLTLNGTGSIRMDPQGGAASINGLFGTPWFLVQNAGHTIEGAGQITSPMQNDGLIEANIAGREMKLTSGSKSNNGSIVATNGATVRIDANIGTAPHFTQSPAGVVRAEDASTVVLSSASTGGVLETQGSGQILIITQGANLNAMTLAPGSTMRVLGNAGVFAGPAGLINHGTIDLGPSGFFASEFANSTTLSGAGRLILGDGAGLSSLFGGGGYALTNGPSHTISGTGAIRLALTNLGTVSADRNGLTTGPASMTFTEGDKINLGLIQAIDTGNIELGNDTTITQSGPGRLFAGNGSAILLNGTNAGIIGGRIGTAGTGAVLATTNPALLESVTIEPGTRVRVLCARALHLGGNIQNEGVITVEQPGCGPNFAELRAPAGAAVSGPGEIRLVASDPINASARLIGDGGPGAPLALGPGQHLTGSGTLSGNLNTSGVIAPDNAAGLAGPIGQMALSGVALAMDGASELNIDIAGPGAFDRLHGSGSVHLDGALALAFATGYAPPNNLAFDILAADTLTGSFHTVSVIPEGIGVRVETLPDRVRVRACRGDANNDGLFDLLDIVAFVTAFTAMTPVADLNQDGLFDMVDVTAFVAAFNGGCPG
jgi:hypothetical protein